MPGFFRSLLFLLLIAIASTAPVPAQPRGSTITGTVVDDSTGVPLPHTHVFISRSMTGTTVDADGHFRLTGISPGAKRLYVTRLGYEPTQVNLVLSSDTTLTFDFRLHPTVIQADTVTVSAPRDKDWYERLDRFERLFVGASEMAARCRLTNPKVLQFDTAWWGKFSASASRPLIFENRALGYRVTYYLKDFEVRGDLIRWDGEPVFAPLSPRDSAEAARWDANRRKAFYGSLRHFLLALINDRIEEEDFRMYRLPRAQAFRAMERADRFPIGRDKIVTGREDSLYTLSFRGILEVQYESESEAHAYLEWAHAHRAPKDYQTSRIRLNTHPIHVDRQGNIVEPYGTTLYRYFAFTRRMAQLLPRGYRPSDTSLTATVSSN
ncbi:hypothetical protein BSZ35_03365 [Salinibacter sp. 10B]|uniref:carboxypeptidase-like regulatory domain-containing protein n=1 Tax=Salinibacter sp. 10B TaxID=1923971 RepID=UPI000CF475FD|nr:carboxypeptidase-like regulatory domain-containing protein [Salinibacter sp. 10B]PQJ33770.1 hypothetical protein BSZ35_03365 [Salinibacter sp. 10B]